ncbi:putative nucleotide-binding alpha-beta plait domain superfamily, RNA-binding domain superfamily [Helianthus annuus]|nr:putative nucleotide-binding alpha-beta plait domain superfamily, RNA-binding domain superfamily [Helianthus annuus]
MEKVARRVGPGIESVELLKDQQNSRRNCGFAFVEYYNHDLQSIQDKRCQTLNLSLTITLQPLAGLTQKMPSPQLLFRLRQCM